MILFSRFKTAFATTFCLVILFSACQQKSPASMPLPSTGCKLTWADSLATDFVKQLELATKTAHSAWPGYALGDGAVVLDAGMNSDSAQHCLGLWQHGKLIDYTTSTEAPKLATPLYGYQLNFEDLKKEDALVKRSQQPAEISNWLNAYELETAVLMPVDYPQFPFKIPALKKMQLAIHESFHVEVMLRYWYTGQGQWPAWDVQPDRRAIRQCYALNEEVSASFQKEKGALIAMINALLDNDKTQTIESGQNYLTLRNARYNMLEEVTIARQDSTQCDCQEAENMMELEEGLADYASWTMLYETGISSREELIKRYNAIQQEPFYLTGAMLMHALSLMTSDDKTSTIMQIINAPNHEEGALFPQFSKAFTAYKSQ